MSSGKKRTYLELSEDDGVSHKFYEVTVDNCDVTIRYGRIGTDGQSSSKKHANAAAAEKDADKKIKAKKKKGYEDAVMGVRQKRAVTRRTVESKQSTAKPAPVLWRFETKSGALGIFVDHESAWVGNEAGRVFQLKPEDGSVIKEFKLPEGVKCLVADDAWLYAGCDDGNVYDLSRDIPHLAYAIDESVDILWLDICDGVLGVSDDKGGTHLFNHEGESMWTKTSKGMSGWMIRCDDEGVYHGHCLGVDMYNIQTGEQKWNVSLGTVMFGWQEQMLIFVGTAENKVHVINKEDGKMLVDCQCDSSVLSCAAAEDGKFIFAGDDCSSIYCFDQDGKRLWKLGTTCGSAFSMQYYDDRVYIVTTDGTMACLDASEAAIQDAQNDMLPEAKTTMANITTTQARTTETMVESSSDVGEGVVVVCVKEGGKIRVHPEDDGKYKVDWNVQFPQNLREDGARFVVDELKESKNSGFYRVSGNIRRLV